MNRFCGALILFVLSAVASQLPAVQKLSHKFYWAVNEAAVGINPFSESDLMVDTKEAFGFETKRSRRFKEIEELIKFNATRDAEDIERVK
jgi:hypothetical protein